MDARGRSADSIGSAVRLTMLSNVKQTTVAPVICETVVPGTLLYTDGAAIYDRLVEWGYGDSRRISPGR